MDVEISDSVATDLFVHSAAAMGLDACKNASVFGMQLK